MKKIGIIILLVLSLTVFGKEYKVIKEKNLTLSEKQIKKENKKIEENLKEVNRNILEKISMIMLKINFSEENETKYKKVLDSYSKMLDLLINNSKIEIESIKYLSDSEVRVKYKESIVKINNEEIEEKIFKKYGYKMNGSNGFLNNAEELSKIVGIATEYLNEKKLNPKNYDVSTEEIELEKVDGKWTSKEMKEFFKSANEFLRENYRTIENRY